MNLDMLDWSYVRSFVTVVREGSLAGAARALRLTHPTVRRHIDEFELALGQPLFLRSRMGLRPTELAQAMLPAAEAMTVAFRYMARSADTDVRSVAGTVRVTASEIIGVEVLPPILARLRALHPALLVELHVTDKVEDIMRYDADIAVRMTRPVQDDLVVRKLARIELGLFASVGWCGENRIPSSLDELESGGVLIGDDRNRTIADGLTAHGLDPDRISYSLKTDSTIAQLAAVTAGIGCGIVQVPLAEKRGLVRLLPDLSGWLDVWLAVHPGQRDVARVRLVADYLASWMQDYTTTI